MSHKSLRYIENIMKSIWVWLLLSLLICSTCEGLVSAKLAFKATVSPTKADSVKNKPQHLTTCFSSLAPLHDFVMDSNDRSEEIKLRYQNEQGIIAIDSVELPKIEDLPKRRHEIYQRQMPEEGLMATTEMFFGRVAMMAAVGLFAGEILSGKSLPEQIVELLR